MTNEHTSLEKYTSHTLFERVVCERWVGDWTDCNILTPSSSDYSSTSFSFCWAAQPGVLRAQALCWELVLTASNSNQLTPTVAPGYIIVWCPHASHGCRNCTKFNPSTVKVISWYLQPDAPVSWLTAGSMVSTAILYQVLQSNTNNLHTGIWYHVFLSNRNNFHTVLWFQSFLSNTNPFPINLFDPQMEP